MKHSKDTQSYSQKWISLEERLPDLMCEYETSDNVLLNIEDEDGYARITIGYCWMKKDSKYHWIDNISGDEVGGCEYNESDHVTAWMPLPEPYAGNE